MNYLKSKLQFTRNVTDKLSIKGILSEAKTFITYVDENDIEKKVLVSDLLDSFKNQEIEFSIQLKSTESLDFARTDNE